MKKDIYVLFFELIRVAIGTQETLSRLPSEAEWEELFEMAVKQSLIGVCFVGIHALGADSDEGYINIGMSEDLYFDWMGMAAQINMKNELMDGSTKDALAYFRNKGFACQVLKGQGIAKLYGDLRGFRQSGDVDVWLNISRKELYALSQTELRKVEGITYHHIHFPIFEDCEVEAHLHPSFLSSPRRNKALKEFCEIYEPKEGCADTPSLAFNRVYILLHCYRHFCGHGIGLRQLLDYFYILQASSINESNNYRVESMLWIKRLGMEKFCKATMWMMQQVFGMKDDNMLCDADEKYGKFLLKDVMQSGNFGHGDTSRRISPVAWKRYLYNIIRDIQIIGICPHEALWSPVFNFYQFIWCKLQKIVWK